MLSELIKTRGKILAECAIAERLRRIPGVELHPTLYNTPLIYGPEESRERMDFIYREYLDVANKANLPLLLTAPTWRLDGNRVMEAGVPESINTDAVSYLTDIRSRFSSTTSPVAVGALTGPMNDCYRPDLAPESEEAERFHSRQINELAETSADFLLAQTLPAVGEALGIARAMARTDKPYVISFCTGIDGRILDETLLNEAMDTLDQKLPRPPLGYFVNCTHPRFLLDAYQPGQLTRLIGIQANGSSKDVTTLDDSTATESDPVKDWAGAMLELHATHEVPILGGCCGTNLSHMQHLVSHRP